MIRLRASDLGLACALIALTGCARPDATFDAKVHDYLLRHPEVVQEAMAALQKKQEAQAAGQAKVAIALNRQAIEHDPRDFVANPGGRITMTEFYDYRCPHCINIAPAVLQIIHDNPNVRVVFKEMPIFGGASDKAAAVALAVKKAGGDYLGLYHDFMAARPLDDAAVSRIARAHGVDPATLDAIAKSPDAAGQIASVRKLAETLGIDGTPAFVIGDTMISGEDVDGVHAALATAQKETKH
jgi:protein-disulfide isomerase